MAANIIQGTAVDRASAGDNSRWAAKVTILGTTAGDIAIVPFPVINRLGSGMTNFFHGVGGATSITIEVTGDDINAIDPNYNGKGSMSNANAADILWVPLITADTSVAGLTASPYPFSAIRVTFTGGTGRGKVVIMAS